MVGLCVSTSAAVRLAKSPHNSMPWHARQTATCARQNAPNVLKSRLGTPSWRNSTSSPTCWYERHLWRQDTTNTTEANGVNAVSSVPLLTEAIVVPAVEGMRELLKRVMKQDTAILPVSCNMWENQDRIVRLRTPRTKWPRTERTLPENLVVARLVAC
jgi:hypothetical protein